MRIHTERVRRGRCIHLIQDQLGFCHDRMITMAIALPWSFFLGNEIMTSALVTPSQVDWNMDYDIDISGYM